MPRKSMPKYYLYYICKYMHLSDPLEQHHLKEIMLEMLPNGDINISILLVLLISPSALMLMKY